ncbi:MAG: serine hydrolase [Christensenellales bacterium]|nr:serine hydrolase [Christensenellales bacterium]
MDRNYLERIRNVTGNVSFYYHPQGGTVISHQPDISMTAASLIKIPIMVEAFRRMEEGTLDPDELLPVRREDKKPSCGVLTYLHDNVRVSMMDLVVLMIIVSDNTATNLLIDRLGIPQVNETMRALGIPGIALRRKLYEPLLERQGIQNTVTARGIGQLLERIVEGTLLGPEADGKMLQILKDQQLNGKIPFYLESMGIEVAHKTGENTGVTHDAGIVLTRRPFVLCMLSSEVEVPAFERLIQDTALALARENM